MTLTRPDDLHLHLRDGDVLASVLPDMARRFARAMVMPECRGVPECSVRAILDTETYRTDHGFLAERQKDRPDPEF